MHTSLVLLAALAAAPAAAGDDAPNLVLITFDTTRADHLSVYGYDQPTTPHLESIASRGVLFETAYSPVGLTGPAHATMLTGLYPHRHGAVRNGVRLSKKVPTLGELLQERGYATGAFVSGWTLKRKLSGLDRGFDVYDDDMSRRTRFVTSERDGRLTTNAALAWLREHRSDPFFLLVHYFDPHEPYHRREGMPIEGDRPKVIAYDTEIRYADAQAGRILRELKRLGVEGETLVVVTADHGESLGENGVWGHSFSVRPEVLQVPLLLRFPGRLPAGRVVVGPVALVDLFPTIGSLMGLETLPEHDGVDLSATARGAPGPDPGRVTWFAAYPGAVRRTLRFLSKSSPAPLKAGYRTNGSRYIWDMKKDRIRIEPVPPLTPRSERSPAHTNGHTHDEPDGARIREAITTWLESRSNDLEADQVPDLSEEDIERLKGLGYIP